MEANKPLRTQVRDMAVGDVITVSIGAHSYVYIRACASSLALDLDRKYSTRVNRAERTCTITRVS